MTIKAVGTDSNELPTTYAIIGGGPAGLVSARAFRRYGIDVEILERHSELGGIWNIDNPGSPMYESCNFICSKFVGGFIGYPMPEDYPIYPRWDQIRDYVHAFARDEGLDQLARLEQEVVGAEPVTTPAGTYWRVTLGGGEVRNYRGIVAATGGQWTPYRPEIAGAENFDGEIIHSAEYTSQQQFKGKRVLVVGAGNSGVDIVVDAAYHSAKALLSTRRGYWYFPKVLFGQPVPDLLQGLASIPDNSLFSDLSFEQIVELIVASVGDLKNYGLPEPDHGVATTHPIVNNQVLHCLAHGLIEHRPGIDHVEGKTVIFTDGRSEEVDTIVLATGFDLELPWLPDGLVPQREGHPEFLLGALAKDVPGLYAAGVLHFADNTFSIFDELVQVAAADAHAELTGENRENLEVIRRGDYQPDLKGDFPFLEVRRNINQIDIPTLHRVQEEIRERFGIEIPRHPDDGGFYQTRPRVQAASA